MTPADLVRLHDFRVECHRETLLKTGCLRPWIDLVCPADGMEERLAKVGGQTLTAGGGLGATDAIVGVPASYHPEWLVRTFAAVCLDEEKRKVLSLGIARGTEFGLSEEEACRIALRALRCGEPENQKVMMQRIIEGLIRHLNAYAMVKADEVWALVTDDPDASRNKSLEHHPDRVEMLLVSTQWKGGSKHSRLPMARANPKDDTSKLLSVGPALVEPPGIVMMGRFAEFFRELRN